MPIVVRHDAAQGSALEAAIALWLAQQQDQQPPPQNRYEELRQALLPALQQRPAKVPKLAAESPDAPASYQLSPESSVSYAPRTVRSYGSRAANDPYSRAMVQSQLADQRYQNQDALAQDRYAQQAQLQDDRLAHQSQADLNELQIREAGLVYRQASEPIPQWIGEGLSSGNLRYSPANRRERAEHEHAMDVLRSSDSFTPSQKANGIAFHQQAIRQLDMSPQETPPNERPITPQQQYEQGSWQFKDPVSGLTLRMQPGGRNGQPQLDPTSQAHLDNWKAEQDHRRKLELEQIKNANANKDTRPKQSEVLTLRRYLDAKVREYDKQQQLVRQADANLQAYNTAISTDKNTQLVEADAESYARDLAAALAASSRLEQEIADLNNQLAEANGNNTDAPPNDVPPEWQLPPALGLPPTPDLSQAAPLGGNPPPPPVESYDPSISAGAAPATPPSPLDAASDPAQWEAVPINGVTTLPNGVRVRKTGPRSYERI